MGTYFSDNDSISFVLTFSKSADYFGNSLGICFIFYILFYFSFVLTFSKSADYFGICLGILWEFFGNSLEILWEFFRNSLGIVTKVSWLCLITKSIVSYLSRFGFLSSFCLKAQGQEFRSLEVRGKLIALKKITLKAFMIVLLRIQMAQ